MKNFLSGLMVVIAVVSTADATLYAQKSRVVEAEGSWEIHGDITKNQAKEKALFEAKKNALAKVGEDVNSISVLITSGDQQQFFEDFSQLSTISIDGTVQLVREAEYVESKSDITHHQVITAKIKAEVVTELKTDPEFVVEVQDIHNSYKSGEELFFTVKPHKSCYLRVFWFDNTAEGKGDIIYPLEQFDTDMMLEEKSYQFPLNKDIQYVMEKKSKTKFEKNILLIVATKKKIPFIGAVNYHNFFRWYHQIASDERTNIECFGFVITD